jgi:hypothetical protein
MDDFTRGDKSSSKIPHPSHEHFPHRVPFSEGEKNSQEMHCMLIWKNTLWARLVVKTHPTSISIAMLAYESPLLSNYLRHYEK